MRGRCGSVIICDDSGMLLHPGPAVQLPYVHPIIPYYTVHTNVTRMSG